MLLNQTIGIIGGGQLGRMMSMAAKSMGYKVIVLDPSSNCPAGQVSDSIILAAYNNNEAYQQLLEQCDVITYEFENLPVDSVKIVESKLPQTSRLLEITQNRILEKKAIHEIGLPTADYTPITSSSELQLFAQHFREQPHVVYMKTAEGGYDGKGQYIIDTAEKMDEFIATHYQSHRSYVAEKAVKFDRELSAIVCRNASGEIAVFPVSENIHHNRILDKSIVPARIKSALVKEIETMAMQLATGLNLVGTLAMELFLCGDEITINELAPRPHNSGHYTLNACNTSQFEQHIRAICNLPLGDVKSTSPCVMLNILGEDIESLDRNKIGQQKLHLYGKYESRVGRKMGHINILGNDIFECLTIADQLIKR